MQWLQALARLYLKSGKDQKLFDVLARLADRDADDLPMRKKLAQLALRAKGFCRGRRIGPSRRCISTCKMSKRTACLPRRWSARRFSGRGRGIRSGRRIWSRKRTACNLALADACLRAGRKDRARELIKAILADDAAISRRRGTAETGRGEAMKHQSEGADSQPLTTATGTDARTQPLKPHSARASPAVTASLEGFQQLIRRMYFEKDAARGIDGTFMWLMEEVGELAGRVAQRNARRAASGIRRRAGLAGDDRQRRRRRSGEAVDAQIRRGLPRLRPVHLPLRRRGEAMNGPTGRGRDGIADVHLLACRQCVLGRRRAAISATAEAR